MNVAERVCWVCRDGEKVGLVVDERVVRRVGVRASGEGRSGILAIYGPLIANLRTACLE